MAFVRNWILNNWHLKLFALLAAFLLWSTYTSEPRAESAYMVRVEFLNLSPQLQLAGDFPAQVRVHVRARPSLLRRVSPGDLGVSVDLADARPGELLVHLAPEMVETPYGTSAVSVFPADFRVEVVKK